MVAMSANATEGLTVAVASNFQATARDVATAFTRATDIPVRITSGSTGHLYAQIVNGAPYDVYLAADTERPRLLVGNGLAVASSFAIYATGHLILWSNDPQFEKQSCYDEFIAGNYSRLAIANPETAPYGLAAKRVLQAAGLWDQVSDRLVYGENIAQAFQFVATRNAAFGLVAASQAITSQTFTATCLVALSEAYTSEASVHQAGVVLTKSKRPAEAQQFLQFILSPPMIELLRLHGY